MKTISFDEAVIWTGLLTGTMFSMRLHVTNPIVIGEACGSESPIELEGTHPAAIVDGGLHLATGIHRLDEQRLDGCDLRLGSLTCEII